MRTSDDQRRETARRLRSVTREELRYVFLEEILNFAVGGRCLDDDGDIDERLILRRLADLIDRPTCFDTEGKDSKSFTCSACGFSESTLVVSPFTLSFFWVKPSYRYCPKCGAMVVKKGAEDED